MTPARGRPRTFDGEKALDQALNLFWERGYPGTSYTDLCAATGLNKPSLYAAFGNKEALFLAALDRYRARHVLPALKALETEPDARKALHAFLISTIDRLSPDSGPDSGPGGCMIATNAACTEAPDVPPQVAAGLMSTMLVSREALTARFQRARAEGQLRPETDIPALITFIETMIAGMAGMAKLDTPREVLLSAVTTAMQVWPG
jgi:AcrR family transcriptional regulator